MGENGEAIDAYNEAIRLDESGIEGRVNLAIIYMAEGGLDNAEELLTQAVERSEYDPHANLCLARLHRERARSSVPYNNVEADQAINRIRRSLQGEPNNPVAYELLSGVYFDLGRLELARLVCENAIELGVDSAPLYNQLGLILLRLDDVTGAYAGFRRAVEMNPRLYEAAMNQGSIALNYRDYRAALESFDLVLAVRPDWDEAIISRGVALRGLEEYEAAAQSYMQALELSPENEASMYNLGVLYQEYMRDYETAVIWFERYLQIDNGDNTGRHEEVNERVNALRELIAYLQGLTPPSQQPGDGVSGEENEVDGEE
jgi:tetratricopeptide (TPR) repeat protein